MEVCIVAPLRWSEEDLTTPTTLVISTSVYTGMASVSRCALWMLFCCSSWLVEEDLVRCVSFFDGRPRMLVIMAGMEQKDSYAACLRPRSSSFLGSGMCLAGFPGDNISRVPFSGRHAQDARHLGPVWTQKDSTSLVVLFGNGMCRAGLLVTLHTALCSLDCRPSSSTTVAVHGWFCWRRCTSRRRAGFLSAVAHHPVSLLGQGC